MMLIVATLHLSDSSSGSPGWHRALEPAAVAAGVIFVSGMLSAFLVNDIVCLVMAPLILGFASAWACDRFPIYWDWQRRRTLAAQRPSPAIHKTF